MQGMHKRLEIVAVDPCQLVEDSSGDTLCLLACSSLLYAEGHNTPLRKKPWSLNGYSVSGQRGPVKTLMCSGQSAMVALSASLACAYFQRVREFCIVAETAKLFWSPPYLQCQTQVYEEIPGPVVMELLQKPTECYYGSFPNSNQRQDLEFLFF
jgi:hypothetical protein